jgi:DNA-directed RNA polymerase specialized sigma24 family protein
LSDREREVIKLHNLDELTIIEIAEKLDLSEALVKKALRTARNRLNLPPAEQSSPETVFEIDPLLFQDHWESKRIQNRQREIIKLKHLSEMSNDQIANRLNLNEEYVANCYRSGIKNLTKIVWFEYIHKMGPDFYDQKRALLLFLKGCSYAEIAQTMDIQTQKAIALVEEGALEVKKLFPFDADDATD